MKHTHPHNNTTTTQNSTPSLHDALPISINASLPSPDERKTVAIHFSKDTILRRYASDSVKFDDAKPAPLDQIKPGDQLRPVSSRRNICAGISILNNVCNLLRSI